MQNSPLNYRLINITAAFLTLISVGWLLFIGRDLLIPLILAVVVWYLIDTLAKSLESLNFGRFRIPRIPALIISLILMVIAILFVLDLVAQNAAALAKDAPTYQANIMQKIDSLLSTIAPNTKPDFAKANELLNIPSLVSWVTSALGNTLSILGLVIIYLLFILLEQPIFDNKFNALFDSNEKLARATHIRNEIANRIRSYVTIKTLVSFMTGFLSFAFLELLGVNYAIFWGFIIFLLNYIPTISSMLGVVFPAALSLVQFDTSWQFFAVVVILGSIQFAVGNILEPKLMGNSLNLSGLVRAYSESITQ